MKTCLPFFVGSLLLFFSCEKNDVDPGCEETLGSEWLTYSYFNEGSPVITESPVTVEGNIFYESAKAEPVSNGVRITIPGVRVRTESDNYEITKFQIDERTEGSNCFTNQFEFNTGSSQFKTDIASVLVLDMSTSLTEVIENLKTYAKDYANTVVNSSDNSTVALVFFSDRDAIETTDFYTSDNIEQLNAIIDNFQNFQERTALYQATKAGIDLVENFNFDGEKSVVTFTDGGDNDSNNPSQLISDISASEIDRFAIGLEGNDLRSDNLENIVSNNSNFVVAGDITDLEEVFRLVGRGVISVYEINYTRSDQLLNQDEAIEIRVSVETQVIQ